MSEEQRGAEQSDSSGVASSPSRGTTRRRFIKTGVAVAGGIILGGEYVKPTLRSVSVNTSIAQAYGPPPPPPPPPSWFDPRTIGYWKNHSDAWPVNSLTLGGVTYTKQQLLNMLKKANAKDMTKMLAAQLIAAKLNVLSGAPGWIQPTIDAADAFLMTYPIGSNPQGSNRTYAESLKNALDSFNNSDGDDSSGDYSVEP